MGKLDINDLPLGTIVYQSVDFSDLFDGGMELEDIDTRGVVIEVNGQRRVVHLAGEYRDDQRVLALSASDTEVYRTQKDAILAQILSERTFASETLRRMDDLQAALEAQ